MHFWSLEIRRAKHLAIVALMLAALSNCRMITVSDPVPRVIGITVNSTGEEPFQLVVSQHFQQTGGGLGLDFLTADTIFATTSYSGSVELIAPPAVAIEVTTFEAGNTMRLRIHLDDELYHDATQVLAAGSTLNFSYLYSEP